MRVKVFFFLYIYLSCARERSSGTVYRTADVRDRVSVLLRRRVYSRRQLCDGRVIRDTNSGQTASQVNFIPSYKFNFLFSFFDASRPKHTAFI